MTLPVDPARRALYINGRSGVFALRTDPRFSYCLYVPEDGGRASMRRLVVAVHHSLRNFIECRDGFAGFAEQHNFVVLAPLFPIDVLGDGDPDGYKFLLEQTLRYDLILHQMIGVAMADTGCDPRRFCLFGYSGGGHFAHRYLLLHPDRVAAASIGAPGQVTTLDKELGWWSGVADVPALFGRHIDLDALRQVPVQLVIGEHDTGDQELEHAPGTRYWRPPEHRHGADRHDRLQSLHQSLVSAGVNARLQIIPGATHESGGLPAMRLAQDFFRDSLGLDRSLTA